MEKNKRAAIYARVSTIAAGQDPAMQLPGRDVPKKARVGSHVAGLIYIGAPLSIPLLPEQFMPSLRHRWRIEAISANITPLVKSVSLSRRKSWQYDSSRVAFRDVDATNVGAMDYVLHCEMLE